VFGEKRKSRQCMRALPDETYVEVAYFDPKSESREQRNERIAKHEITVEGKAKENGHSEIAGTETVNGINGVNKESDGVEQ